MVFLSIYINSLSLKRVVDLDRDAEKSTSYYKEKKICADTMLGQQSQKELSN